MVCRSVMLVNMYHQNHGVVNVLNIHMSSCMFDCGWCHNVSKRIFVT